MHDTILQLIVESVSSLRRDPDQADRLRPRLREVRSRLEQAHLDYEAPAPEGAEEVRELILEATYRYCQALDILDKAIGARNLTNLPLILELAQEAAEILDDADDAVDEKLEELDS